MLPYIARAIASAARQINAKGGLCMWVQPSASTPDPAKPWRHVAGAEISHSARIVFFQRGGDTASLLTLFGGSDVQVGKRYAFMAAQPSFVPKITDYILLPNGEKETLTAIDPLKPDGVTPIFYTLELRA